MAKDPAMGPITKYDEQGKQTISDPQADQLSQVTPPVGGPIKTVIWAGGRGTRLVEETKGVIPKPMLEIGDIPMLEHIINIYNAQGYKDFMIAGGRQIEKIKTWGAESLSRLTAKELRINIVGTGYDTQTGGRLLRIKNALFTGGSPRRFMATYGDGLADINLTALMEFHRSMVDSQGVYVTLTAVRPPARFGNLKFDFGLVSEFGEKTQTEHGWINGGFYVIEEPALELINGDNCKWEYDVLPQLALQGKLAGFQHPGYFQMCDTARDLQVLRDSWDTGVAPWSRFG